MGTASSHHHLPVIMTLPLAMQHTAQNFTHEWAQLCTILPRSPIQSRPRLCPSCSLLDPQSQSQTHHLCKSTSNTAASPRLRSGVYCLDLHGVLTYMVPVDRRLWTLSSVQQPLRPFHRAAHGGQLCNTRANKELKAWKSWLQSEGFVFICVATQICKCFDLHAAWNARCDSQRSV